MDHSERSNRMRFDSTSPRPPTYCTAAPLRLRARAASAQRETSESWIYLCFNLNLVTKQLMWQQWGLWLASTGVMPHFSHCSNCLSCFYWCGPSQLSEGKHGCQQESLAFTLWWQKGTSPKCTLTHGDIKHSLTCEHEYNIINSTLQHIGASHSVNVDVFYSLSVLLTPHFSQYLQLFVCVRLATILSTHFLHSAS